MAYRSGRKSRSGARRSSGRVRRTGARSKSRVRSGGGVHTVRVVVQSAPAPSVGPTINPDTGQLAVPVSPRVAKF